MYDIANSFVGIGAYLFKISKITHSARSIIRLKLTACHNVMAIIIFTLWSCLVSTPVYFASNVPITLYFIRLFALSNA